MIEVLAECTPLNARHISIFEEDLVLHAITEKEHLSTINTSYHIQYVGNVAFLLIPA